MGYIVKNNNVVFLTEEAAEAEGTAVNPSAGGQAIQPMADGMEMTPNQESLDRNTLNSGIGMNKALKGNKSVSGSLPVELKTSGTAGTEAETDLLYRSLMGSRRKVEDPVTADDTNVTHTSTVIGLGDSDANKYAVGDIVRVRRGTDADHISFISAVSHTAGSVSITLGIANPLGAHADGDVVSPVVSYTPANDSHPSFTVTEYQEDAIKRQGAGCKVTSASLQNWATGQMPSMNFAFEGISLTEEVSAKSVTEAFDSSIPPVVLNSKFYLDGTQTCVNNISLEIANTLGFVTCTDTDGGRKASRATSRTVTLNIDPYADDTSVAEWTKFNNNTDFSVFFWAGIPDANSGQYKDIIAFYLPQCQMSEFSKADIEGNVNNNIAIKAHRGNTGADDELFISMI